MLGFLFLICLQCLHALRVQWRCAETVFIWDGDSCPSLGGFQCVSTSVNLMITLSAPMPSTLLSHFFHNLSSLSTSYYHFGLTFVATLPSQNLASLPHHAIIIHLQGLAEAHKYHVVHRDIKPANLFVKGWKMRFYLCFRLCLSRVLVSSASLLTDFGPQGGNFGLVVYHLAQTWNLIPKNWTLVSTTQILVTFAQFKLAILAWVNWAKPDLKNPVVPSCIW